VLSKPDLLQYIREGKLRFEPPVSENRIARAQTAEKVFIPSDLVGFVEGRSSYARIGVTIHVTAPKIDPGFEAPITLEMANFGKIAVDLRAGIDQPAQLMLFRLSTPLDEQQLYGARDADVFQYQTDPIPRRPR
jgi:deoxycytidine triphosphate deaminase